MTSTCLSQTSKPHIHHSTLEKSKVFPLLKMCRLSRVYILAKGALRCAKRVLLQKENPHARLPRTRTKSPLTIFFSLACQFVPRRVSRDICDWRFRPYNSSPCLHTYYEWGTTGSFSGYVGRRLKRNRRANPAGIAHVEAAEVAIAAENAPNDSVTIAEADRRQRPPISICSIFL